MPSLDMMMPNNRPDNIKHYVSRNANHMAELDRLKRGIVLTPGPNAGSLTHDEVAGCVAASGLVEHHQLAIGLLQGGRFLIILSEAGERILSLQ
jgi:hypothetical protein